MKNYILEDIPPHYEGALSLRLNQKYIGDRIYFEINQKAIVYIGIKEKTKKPIDKTWEVNKFNIFLRILKNIFQ